MYDVGSLYVMDEAKEKIIEGFCHEKIYYGPLLNTNIDGTPVCCLDDKSYLREKPAHQILLFLKLLTLCKPRSGFFRQSLKRKS